MGSFTPVSATSGGALLGLAASLLLLTHGRILGVSGILGGAVARQSDDRAWRLVFLAGLAVGALGVLGIDRDALAFAREQSVPVALVAGVLVGVGTRLGSGCTSGHGLCGMARLSKRSITATLVFMATAAVTVFVARHLLHAGSGT